MAKMFHTNTDENGVSYSTNCHPVSDYGPAPADQRPGFPHLMQQSGAGPYIDPAPTNIVHKTKDRVLFRLGRPGAGMSFEGDLEPRADRVKKERD